VVLDIDGNATTYLNGERINPDEYLDNVLTIEGSGSGAEYTVSTSGTLKHTGANGASINTNDDIQRSTVNGMVGGGRDSYKVSVNIRDGKISCNAAVYLNGDEITL